MDRPPAQPARRRAERAARARRRRRRRLVLLLASAAGLAVALVAIAASGGGGGGNGQPATATAAARLVVSAKPASPLPAPISGESAAAVPGGVLIIGGLDSSESSVSGVFRMSATGGSLAPAGSLSSPLHDAAAATLGSHVLVFGGGEATSTDAVESLPAAGGSASAEVVGHLPAPRSDLSAVTIGGQAYLLGGYDGQTPDPSVLRTADGVSFRQVASLPVPARYVAAAALRERIYAFGGETAGGANTDAIREVDPRSGSARVVGHLPEGISHAAAVTLGGRIYVLGGEAGGAPLDRIWSFDPGSGTVTPAGRLPLPVSGGAVASAGTTAYLIGGKGRGGTALPNVIALRLRRLKPKPQSTQSAAQPTSNPTSWPFNGKLMIADRGNDRIIVVNAQKKVLWRYPSHAHPAPPGGFYFPDDAFFTHHGTQIISNEEQDERIVQIGFPSGKLLWTYGHAGVTGSEPGYLHEPDDAYLWRNGTISVADAQNCRVLIISQHKKVLREIGSPASCEHDPPRYLGSPNGDTPLRDGNLLISEVNGSYIDEITPRGKLVWSVQLPIAYPSDPQQLGRNRYLVADYAEPGGIYEFNRQGRILWSYHPSSGNGMLNHPSLAERLPNGLIAVNDDYRHRVVLIDRHTRRIVWQYGRTDHPGRGPGLLNTPDGFDLLEPGGVTPTHPFTG